MLRLAAITPVATLLIAPGCGDDSGGGSGATGASGPSEAEAVAAVEEDFGRRIEYDAGQASRAASGDEVIAECNGTNCAVRIDQGEPQGVTYAMAEYKVEPDGEAVLEDFTCIYESSYCTYFELSEAGDL